MPTNFDETLLERYEREERQMIALEARLARMGYSIEELERDNPFNNVGEKDE